MKFPVGHFQLLSPGTDEAFFLNCGHVMDKTFNKWTCTVQYITLPTAIYGNTCVIIENTQMKFSGVADTNLEQYFT